MWRSDRIPSRPLNSSEFASHRPGIGIKLRPIELGVMYMDYSDYLREHAAECRRFAEAALDPAIREDLFESAAIYEEVANDLDDRRCGG